jgi:hypothetical protein
MRLVRAEILKLRRRYGLMAWAAILTVGSVVVAYGVLLALHAANAARHGPAGGAENLKNVAWLLTMVGGVAAVLIGTTAGSQDRAEGVFRDLVVTGRSRRTLFRVRVPGALAVYLPLLATGFALAVAGSYAFAGTLATPSLHDVVHHGLAIGSFGAVTLVVAVALGSILPARIATALVIGWNAVVANMLAGFTVLGGARQAIDLVAAMHFAPSVVNSDVVVPMATSTAVIVLLAWVGVALRVGGWWTQRLDA